MVKKAIFTRNKPLAPEPAFEQNEATFWKEVAKKSESMIADLIEKVLPISATPNVFNLKSDIDYQRILNEDLPIFYQDDEDYQIKISQNNWSEVDVEYVSEDLTCQYFETVVSSLTDWLSKYNGFDATSLTNLGEI